MKLSKNDGREKCKSRRVGNRGGGKQQVGQPMQILPEQRANQRGRQPLQRSGLPLVTGRRNPQEGREKDAEVDRKGVQ